ncbi:hypothetical protein [Brevibacterium luteolum]|uniref:hypothetical protein n=1 Tax=Brevibacterium luteolum TaxID=199591 RepID=UPI001C2368DB|nr:hypothetical protein [Brevibacterium luteolum]MBU8578222.1 hypothetical protein [Brevibacterium luteolum]
MTSSKNAERNIDGTLFTFPSGWRVGEFDTWQQYRDVAGQWDVMGCDIVAFNGTSLWLIEVKDYTYPNVSPPQNLTDMIALKAVGTMAVLFAQARSASDSEASSFARACHSAQQIQLALHINVRRDGRSEKQIKASFKSIHHRLRRAKQRLRLAGAFISSNQYSLTPVPWKARRDPATRREHTDQ